MQWDGSSTDWYGIERCEIPEDLRDELLSFYCMSEAQKITKTRGELTYGETEKIQGLCKKLANKLNDLPANLDNVTIYRSNHKTSGCSFFAPNPNNS